MNWRAIQTIIFKDLKVVRQSKAVMLPIVLVPLILLAIMPLALGVLMFGGDDAEQAMADIRSDLDLFLDNVPASMAADLDAFDTELQGIAYFIFVYFFAPLFLVLPVMVANVIAADSFVGEKERKTLEALIYTPTSDRELYLAKLLAPWIAGVVIALVGAVVYGVVVNLVTGALLDVMFFPNLIWIALVLWVAPPAAGLGLATMVLVSSRVNTFQEAYQLGGVVVVPIVLLVVGQVAGVVYFSLGLVLLLGLLLWVADFAIIWYGARTFQRGVLISRLS
jgi:ABC-2 type transport system permease protein